MKAFTIFICCLISPVVYGKLLVTSVPTSPEALGQDNPHWDIGTNSVYFADYFGVLLFRYSLDEQKVYTCTVDGVTSPSFIVPVHGAADRFLVGSEGSGVIVQWDGYSDTGCIEQTIFTVAPNTIINSVYVTSSGDLYLGNYGPTYCDVEPVLSLYKFTAKAGLVEIANHYKSTVGVAIVGNQLYHLDACSQILRAFDLDPVTEELCNEREILQLQYDGGQFLVGLAADIEGNLYTGVYGGSVLTKIDPSIPAIEEIEFPTPLVSAPGFGGDEGEYLFVTTANLPIDPYTNTKGTPIRDPPAGDLFVIEGLPALGAPSYRVRI